MARKSNPENERAVSSDAAASRPRRPAANSRARRTPAPAVTPKPVPPAAHVDQGAQPASASGATAPKPRRKTPAARTTRSRTKAEKPATPAAHVDQGAQPASAPGATAPKPRRTTPAARTTRSLAKAEKPATPAANRAKPPKQDTAVRLVVPAAAAQPSPEAIAQLAYQYWQERGGRGGSPDEDWLRAERELQR